MKKIILSCFALAMVGHGHTQLLNLGLNTWVDDEPEHWTTTNGAAPMSVNENTASPAEGSSAALLNVAVCPDCPLMGLPGDLPGNMGQHANFAGGRPATLDFKWRGSISAGDTAVVGIWFYFEGDTVGQGTFEITNIIANTWTTQTINITYADGSNPDSVFIMAAADSWFAFNRVGTSDANTYLLVDDFVLSGTVTGITSLNEDHRTLMAYPNPASHTISFDLNGNKAVAMEIVDLSGQQAYAGSDLSPKNNIDISHLDNGIYIARFFDDQKNYMGTTRFNIAK